MQKVLHFSASLVIELILVTKQESPLLYSGILFIVTSYGCMTTLILKGSKSEVVK